MRRDNCTIRSSAKSGSWWELTSAFDASIRPPFHRKQYRGFKASHPKLQAPSCKLRMGKKRKRPIKSKGLAASSQTSSTAAPGRFKPSVSAAPNSQSTTHPVISLYYRQVLTLRQYLLNQLPISSKSRRRRIASLSASSQDGPHCAALSALLDSTLVGVLKERSPSVDSNRQREYRAFTQSQSRSILASTDTGPDCPQSEVRIANEHAPA